MRIVKALKTVNYRLWFAILATMLRPTASYFYGAGWYAH